MLPRILRFRPLKRFNAQNIQHFSAVRVILLQPPGSCKTFTRSQSVYPPLGLCQLASTVSEELCRVVDAEGLNLSAKDTVRHVVDYHPSCVGFTVTTMTMSLVNRYARAIKEVDPTVLVIAGGPQATAAPDTVLRECPSVDVVFRGEGEVIFPKIVHALHPPAVRSIQHSLSAIASLPGIVPRTQQDVARTIAVQRVPTNRFHGSDDFFPLPFPALDKMPLESYWSPDALRRPMVTFMTARGCPFQCAFCATPATIGRSVRGWEPSMVVAELARLARLGIKEVSFVDDLFTAVPQRVKALCRGLIEQQVDITWFANTRADRVSPELCDLMKRAGCHQLFLGVESGSPKMLKYVKKGETPETMVRGADIIRNAGISISAGFIIGLPGETDETVEETIALARQIRPNRIQFSRWTPLAGSALVEQPEAFPIDPLTAPALESYLRTIELNHENEGRDRFVPDGGVVQGAGGFHGMPFRLAMMEASIRGAGTDNGKDDRVTVVNAKLLQEDQDERRAEGLGVLLPPLSIGREAAQEVTGPDDRVDRWIRRCYDACGAKRTGEVDWGLPSI